MGNEKNRSASHDGTGQAIFHDGMSGVGINRREHYY
jgi:hypothetical protein